MPGCVTAQEEQLAVADSPRGPCIGPGAGRSTDVGGIGQKF